MKTWSRSRSCSNGAKGRRQGTGVKPNEPAGEASGLTWRGKSEMNHPHRVKMRKLLVSAE